MLIFGQSINQFSPELVYYKFVSQSTFHQSQLQDFIGLFINNSTISKQTQAEHSKYERDYELTHLKD